MHNSTPESTGHSSFRMDRSDGANTRILGGSPAGPTYTHHYTQYAMHGQNLRTPTGFSPIRRTTNSPYYSQTLPDARELIPKPADSFIERLRPNAETSQRDSDMKPVYTALKTFTDKFNGSTHEDWSNHIDMLETNCFEANNFSAKQCYYAIKFTLMGRAQLCLKNLELGLERPDWRRSIPEWYQTTRDDLNALVHQHVFSRFKYPFRCALLIVYFHQKFQYTTAKSAWKKFDDAAQKPKESIENWAARLEQLETNLRKYGVELTFDDIIDKWSTGTTPGKFLTKLREAKMHVNPNIPPTIYDKASFGQWKTAMLAFHRKSRLEDERRQELIARNQKLSHKQANTGGLPRNSRNSDFKGRTRQYRNDREKTPRNPHSNLLKQPGQQHREKNKHSRPDIKCYNCNQMGHFASKCPQPKRPRRQRLNAKMADMMPHYEEEEMHTPEAIRDTLQASMQVFLANVLNVIDPVLEERQQTQEAIEEDTQPHSDQEEDSLQTPDKSDREEGDREDYDTPEHEEHMNHNSPGEDAASEYTYSAADLTAVRADLSITTHKATLTGKPEKAESTSGSSSEEEPATPNRWTFSQCVDRPIEQWTTETANAVSMLTDLLYPRLRSLAEKKGLKEIPFNLDEVAQLTWWACMCTITSTGELTEIMVNLLNSCMKAWKVGKSAIRRALRKCSKLASSLGETPIPATDVDTRLHRCASAASEHALVDTIMCAMGLRTEKQVPATKVTGVRYDIRAKMDKDDEPLTVAIWLTTPQLAVQVDQSGYSLVTTSESAQEAWQFITAWLAPDHKLDITVVDPLNLLQQDTFWAEHKVSITRTLKTSAAKESPTEEAPVTQVDQTSMSIHTVPIQLRMVRTGRNRSAVPIIDTAMHRLLNQVNKMGIYVLACTNPNTPAEIPTSWLFDTGTEISQISMSLSKTLWSSLTPIETIRAECVTAFSKQNMDLQLCLLHRFQLMDPMEGVKQKPITTHVMINPKLRVHGCVLGRNTMKDLKIMCNLRSDTIHTYTGKRIHMLTKEDEKIWAMYHDDDPTGGAPDDPTGPSEPDNNANESTHAKDTKKSTTKRYTTTSSKSHKSKGKPPQRVRTGNTNKVQQKGSKNTKPKRWAKERRQVKRQVSERWGKTMGRYTADDKQQLKLAKQRIQQDMQEDQKLIDRVANVAISSQPSVSPHGSPMQYQPYQRLVRVADILDQSSDMSEGSLLGARAMPSILESSAMSSVSSTANTPWQTRMQPERGSRETTATDTDSPPWAAAYPLPMQFMEDGTPISSEMAMHTPIKCAQTRQPWTPERFHEATGMTPEDNNTLDSETLYRQTQTLFASPVPLATFTPNAKVQTKLSFQRVHASNFEEHEEFPVDTELMDSLNTSLPADVLQQLDPTAAEPQPKRTNGKMDKNHLLPIRIDSRLWTAEKAGNTPVDRLMQTIANYQSFILAGPDIPMPQSPMASWIYDSGTQVSQVSAQAAQRLWKAIRPVQRTRLFCVTAFESQAHSMQLCELRDLQLNDPESGNLSQRRNTLVFINTALSAHECILGMNTMMDFQLTADTLAGYVFTPDGMKFTLLTERQEKIWSTHGRQKLVIPPDPDPHSRPLSLEEDQTLIIPSSKPTLHEVTQRVQPEERGRAMHANKRDDERIHDPVEREVSAATSSMSACQASLQHASHKGRSRDLNDAVDKTKSQIKPTHEATTLQQTLQNAASYGAYMPIVVNGIALLWHVDSGATVTQISPDMLPAFQNTLIKLDEDEVNFNSAVGATTTKAVLYRADQVSLIHLDAGKVTVPRSTSIVCNPQLAAGTMLLGLGSLKDLRVRDDFNNDTLIDECGRPFRKYPRARIQSLKQRIRVWNHKQVRPVARSKMRSRCKPVSLKDNDNCSTPQKTKPTHKVPQSKTRKQVVKTQDPQSKKSRDSGAHTFQYAEFKATKFDKAEQDNDQKYFRQCLVAAPHQTYLWSQASGKEYPNFHTYLDHLHVVDPQLYHEWEQINETPKAATMKRLSKKRRQALKRKLNKSSTSPTSKMNAHVANASACAAIPPPAVVHPLPEAPGPPPPVVHPTSSTFTRWSSDPTPPHLVRKLEIPRQQLPDKALELHPDLFWSLTRKAKQKWGRAFDVMGTAGCFRLRSTTGDHDRWVPNKVIPMLKNNAMLIIPSVKSVKATLRRVLKATQKSPSTAALLLIPQALLEMPEVSTFLHAYAERGESYCQGPRFREVGKTEWLQLNQSIHEFWINPAVNTRPQISRRQQRLLDRLLDKYSGQLGDANTSAAQRQSTAGTHVPYVRLPVKTGCDPASEPPFKKNPTVRQLTIDFVRDLEARGLVSRCTAEEAHFVCNSLMLPKPNHKYRFVCTFQHLNANMVKDPYGMRTLDAVLTALEGKSWFSVLDVVDGFFNLPLYPADRGYTAFHTPIGVYKWNVLPQGTAASPQIFQRTMDKWFAAYLWQSVIIWMDDILVHSTTFDEHLLHLEQVLRVAKNYGLVFNKSKLVVCQRSVKYIGYIFGVDGIHADPDKVADVHKLPAPTSPKQVRQFLGFAGFYRRFMPPSYATLIAPLTELTRKAVPFAWTPTCQRAFEKIKTLLTTTPVLSHPDFSLPFHVHCDASGKGIGAVLSQYVDGSYRPIAFCSKRLLPHQTHWAPAQLEAYAVFYAVCVKWRYYLALNKTIVHTDHRNLSWLFTQSHKGMIGRWHAQLCAYDLDITYVQGRTQVVADPLSRMLNDPTPAPQWTVPTKSAPTLKGLMATLHNPTPKKIILSINGYAGQLSSEPKELFSNASPDAPDRCFKFLNMFVASKDTACNMSREEWSKAQRQDERLGPIIRFLENKSTGDVHQHPKWVQIAAQSYDMQQGVLKYKAVRQVGKQECDADWVVAVPVKFRIKVIQECHSSGALGHNGITKTVLAMRQRYHFPGLRKAVARYIALCTICIRAKAHQLANIVPLSPMFAPSPFNAIAIDLFKPGTTLPSGYRYVLTVIDMCTRWVQFIPLRTKYAAEVMLALCKFWFAIHGVPEFILSDRGKEFMGVVTTICIACDIKQIRTTPGHPQANGLCEAQHRTLTRELKIRARRRNQPTWDDLLTEIQFATNVSPDLVAPGVSPFQMVFGRKPRLAGKDITFPNKVLPTQPVSADAKVYVHKLCKRLQGFQLAALDKQFHRKEQMRQRHDKQRLGTELVPVKRGDLVHRYNRTSQPKLQYQWSNPVWLVIEAAANTCKLKSLISPQGRQGKPVPLKVTNRKHIRPATARPFDFWVGARVRRQFKNNWFLGTIVGVQADEGDTLYQIEFDDCDQEELDAGQVWDAVIYHPRMDDNQDALKEHPKIGTFVLFSQNQYPRVGKVTAVDSNARKPITVQLWKPNKNCRSIALGKFRPSMNIDSTDLVMLQGAQVRLQDLELDEEGYFTKSSKNRVRKMLKPKQAAVKVTPGNSKMNSRSKVTPGDNSSGGGKYSTHRPKLNRSQRHARRTKVTHIAVSEDSKARKGLSRPSVSPKVTKVHNTGPSRPTRQTRYHLRKRY